MLTTRTRKQGNSIIITLPSANEKKFETDQEYFVNYLEDGSIILTPKLEDPFSIAETASLYEADIWQDMPNMGKEL